MPKRKKRAPSAAESLASMDRKLGRIVAAAEEVKKAVLARLDDVHAFMQVAGMAATASEPAPETRRPPTEVDSCASCKAPLRRDQFGGMAVCYWADGKFWHVECPPTAALGLPGA